MTRPLTEYSVEKELGQHSFGIQRQEFMPLAFTWRTPDVDDPPPDGPTPALENGFAQPADPLEKFSYRLHSDASLEFKGHLDVSGAASGDVALTLPTPVDEEDMEPSYRLPNDQFFITTMYDGASPVPAMVYIVGVSGDGITGNAGEVMVTWPV